MWQQHTGRNNPREEERTEVGGGNGHCFRSGGHDRLGNKRYRYMKRLRSRDLQSQLLAVSILSLLIFLLFFFLSIFLF